MSERPIIFSAEMVRAILDGRKTQTRRVVKLTADGHVQASSKHLRWHPTDPGAIQACRYGQPGDLLWVREPFCAHWYEPPRDAPQSYRIVNGDELPPIKQADGDFYQPTPSDIMTIWYGAKGDKPFHMEWKPSIHMNRWASRITLRITDIRVERLQDISEDDAKAEGCESPLTGAEAPAAGPGVFLADERTSFAILWNKINGPGAWSANPWVWVVSFERMTNPIRAALRASAAAYD